MAIAPQYDEKELLMQVAAGDRKAFTDLYSVYVSNVYQFVFLFTRSKDNAEEIIQDVFVSIWEKKEKLAEVTSFKSYLFKAAKNKLIDEVRHLQIRHRVLAEIKRNKAESYDATNNEVDYKEYYKAVQEAIQKLPPKRKMIFQLSTEQGLSHDEIAEQLRVSKSFVKNQLYKALDFVRQYLSKHGNFYSPALIPLLLVLQ
jgi:RNA polymerase sigma-70 factor (ECF subfamily)